MLQRRERVGGATLAEVEVDGGQAPAVSLSSGHEVDGEPAQGTAAGEQAADGSGVFGQ